MAGCSRMRQIRATSAGSELETSYRRGARSEVAGVRVGLALGFLDALEEVGAVVVDAGSDVLALGTHGAAGAGAAEP